MSQSQNINYNPRIDELRGIACILVFIAHGFGFFRICEGIKIFPLFGICGVAIFFILSGYLFTTIFLNKQEEINYKNFITNRFLRIFPLFIVFMLFIITCYPSYFKADQLLYFFTLQWNIFLKSSNFSPELSTLTYLTWTIAVEFQFYLLFPFLFKFYKKYGLKYLYFLFSLIFIFSIIILYINPLNLRASIFTSMLFFIMGMILVTIRVKFIKYSFIPFSIIIFIIMSLLPIYIGSILYLYINIILVFLFIYFYLNQKRIFPKLYIPLQKLGIISYSFYLTHMLCIQFVLNTIHGHRYISFIVAFILTVLLSILTYNVIEKPFMSLRKKY